jgi:hypothetical protein
MGSLNQISTQSLVFKDGGKWPFEILRATFLRFDLIPILSDFNKFPAASGSNADFPITSDWLSK